MKDIRFFIEFHILLLKKKGNKLVNNKSFGQNRVFVPQIQTIHIS